MLITEVLEKNSKSLPDKEAIVSKDKRFTYSEVQRMVNQLSNALINDGIGKGDRVAILSKNTYEAVVAYFAILKIGGVEVALSVTTDSPKNITYKLNDCEAKALITSSSHVNLVSDALSKASSLKTIYFNGDTSVFKNYKKKTIALEEVFKIRKTLELKVSLKGDDLAIISYTSGTAGMPKGVMLTHKNLFFAAKTASRDLNSINFNMEKDKCLLLIPLYHAFGKQILNSRFMKGGTIVLIENIVFPIEILKIMRKEKVTGVVGVPTIYKMLLDALKKSKETYFFDYITYIHSGGSSIAPELIIELREIFSKAVMLNGYGLTEAGPRISITLFTHRGQLARDKLNSCGKPDSGYQISIVDESGKEVKPGEIGEVIFKGPSVMKGYWRKPEETKKVLRDGWLYTGDLGKVDAEGDLYIIDRKKDIIKSGGELIAPKEIEMVIDSHPDVKESAVIGIKDELMGEKIKAFVVLKLDKKVSEEEIIDFCAEHLPFVKIPTSVEFRLSLPKSTLDKVKRAELRKKKNE